MGNGEKLILGTVQLGMNYGINNSLGKPSLDEAFFILDHAHQFNITHLDTASAYGDAESIIGEYITKKGHCPFRVISKFHVDKGVSVNNLIEKSLNNLSINTIDTLLFHSFQDFKDYPEVLRELIKEREKGKISRIGVSIYKNAEIAALIHEPEIEVIQVPFNLLDNEYQRGELLKEAKANGKTVHTRSVFLQGLFFKSLEQLPAKLEPLRSGLEKIHQLNAKAGSAIHQLALSYVLSKPYIDGALIGVDSVDQLHKNLEIDASAISDTTFASIDQIKVEAEELLHPSNWN